MPLAIMELVDNNITHQRQIIQIHRRQLDRAQIPI